MKWGQGLSHPLGVSLLLTSVALGVLAALDLRWSGQEVWLLIWGVAIYASVAGYVALSKRDKAPPAAALLPASGTTLETAPADLVVLLENALRNLGNPGALVTSGLIGQLPLTLAAARDGAGKVTDTTPLEQAQLLRSVLEASIERLRPEQRVHAELDSLQYHILHEHYVLRRPTSYTMTRHSIAESTFHRGRRQAIRGVAADLAAQEASFAREAQLSR